MTTAVAFLGASYAAEIAIDEIGLTINSLGTLPTTLPETTMHRVCNGSRFAPPVNSASKTDACCKLASHALEIVLNSLSAAASVVLPALTPARRSAASAACLLFDDRRQRRRIGAAGECPRQE